MDNKTIAALFQEMAEFLDIQGGEQYRARSFRRVAHVIEELAEPAQEALSFGTLQRRRGVGQGSIERIKVMLRTGTCRDLDLLRAHMPSGVRELLRVDGLGPRSVRLIHNHLGVGSVNDLELAALTGRLARLLVQQHQLRGDLNVHTVASDSQAPVRAMAEAALAVGLHYLAITDHSRSATRRRLDEHTLQLQARHIRQLDGEIDGIRLLAGVEVEILPGGELALDRSALLGLDWVAAAVHTELGQDRKQMTDRLIRAMNSLDPPNLTELCNSL